MYQCSGPDPYMFLGLPDPHPDTLFRGIDPRIRIRNRIRAKMSQIRKQCKF